MPNFIFQIIDADSQQVLMSAPILLSKNPEKAANSRYYGRVATSAQFPWAGGINLYPGKVSANANALIEAAQAKKEAEQLKAQLQALQAQLAEAGKSAKISSK